MFAPTKIWRKWHVKINQGQKYVAWKLMGLGTLFSNLLVTGVSLLPLLSPPPPSLPS